jgi:hypothetical protein
MNEQEARRILLEAVVAIWQHTETHTIFVEGIGYTSRSDVPAQQCGDPVLHARLASEEGAAWHIYREFIVA